MTLTREKVNEYGLGALDHQGHTNYRRNNYDNIGHEKEEVSVHGLVF